MALDFPNSPTNGQTYSANNITWVYETSSTTWKVKQDGTVGKIRVAKVTDVKGNRVGGGQITANTWTTRDLNTISDPSNIGLTVADNKIKVPAGTYRIKWRAPSWRVYTFQTKLEYSTDSGFGSGVSKVLGSSEFSSSTDHQNVSATSSEGLAPSLTFTQDTYVRIRQWAGGTGPSSNNGLGVATYNDIADTESGENTVYTTIEVEDLATAVKDNATYVEGTTKVAILYDAKSQNTDGGTASGASWNTRILNTKVDPGTFVTFGGGSTGTNGTNTSFSLPAGSYHFEWRAPAWDAGLMRARLAYNVNSDFSGTTNYILGESAQSDAGSEANTFAFGTATLTPAATTYFRIEHYVSSAPNDQTLGLATNIAEEIYTQVIIQDLATAVKNSSNKLLNVWHVQKTDTQTIDNETWTDLSSLSQSVTATSASSKFLITATVNCGMSADSHDGLLRLMRSTTVIGSTSSHGSTTANNTGFGQVGGQTGYYNAEPLTITYLDTPGSGTHTYHIEGRNNNNASNLLVNTRGAGGFYTTSHMSIQEIA